MMTMLEKAAKALLERAGYTEYGPIVPESLAVDLARAVLMAVRNDEEGANRAWMECAADFDTGPEETFTAMIDAILSEPQP